MMQPANNIDLPFTVLLFGGMRDALRVDRIEVTVSRPATQEAINVADLLEACAEQFPMVAPWLPHLRVAVNHEYVTLQTSIKNGDEIALIPPIAGGYI
jgi:molybdopterin converting factor small subunit